MWHCRKAHGITMVYSQRLDLHLDLSVEFCLANSYRGIFSNVAVRGWVPTGRGGPALQLCSVLSDTFQRLHENPNHFSRVSRLPARINDLRCLTRGSFSTPTLRRVRRSRSSQMKDQGCALFFSCAIKMLFCSSHCIQSSCFGMLRHSSR